MLTTVEPAEMYRIVFTDHDDPFRVLGAHPAEVDGRRAISIRAFLPEASEAFVVEARDSGEERHRMTLLHPAGFFEVILPERTFPFRYELVRMDEFGRAERFLDSYSFQPTVTNYDLHLFGEGKNYRVFEKMGAHLAYENGVGGLRFTVWAPQAKAVSLIGSFNNWDRRMHAMRRLDSGVWEIFVPGLEMGVMYKYQIKTMHDVFLDKTDPYAFRMQVAPRTASIAHQLGSYQWRDAEWLEARKNRNVRLEPMSIYEVHLGSWLRASDGTWGGDRPLTYLEMIETLVPYVKDLGYTHVEFLPVMEHPFVGSWGYQVTGYYAPNSRFGSPEDLMALIDAFHQAGIGVIMDWVPAHFPKDAHAIGRFDGTGAYEHIDPRLGEHQDWGTYIFNFGRSQVRNFLIGSALFWIENYHADALRIDALTSMLYLNYSRGDGQWIPNKYGGPENLDAIDFVQELNRVVHQYHPGVFLAAEESTSWPGVTRPDHLGGLGFDMKWNMGWMHDTLDYVAMDPIFRKYHHGKLTFSIWYAFNEAFLLPLSHDEVVHLKRSLLSKMPGNADMMRAGLRLLFGYQYGHPGKKLLFMGGEIGQWREWHHDRSLDWFLLSDPGHKGIQQFVKDLNWLYRSEPAFWELDHSSEGFEWVDLADSERSIIAFVRKGNDPDDTLLFVYNFTPVPRMAYRVGVDEPGIWRELLNSDGESYGGSNLGNYGRAEAQRARMHGRDWSLELTLPPMAMLIFKREAPPKPPEEEETGAAAEERGKEEAVPAVTDDAVGADQTAPLPEPSEAPKLAEDTGNTGD